MSRSDELLVDSSDQSLLMVDVMSQSSEGSPDLSNLSSNDMEFVNKRSDAFSESRNDVWGRRSDDQFWWSSTEHVDVDGLLLDDSLDLSDHTFDVSDVLSKNDNLLLDDDLLRSRDLLDLLDKDVDLVSDVSDLLSQSDDLVDILGNNLSDLDDSDSDLLWMDTGKGWSHQLSDSESDEFQWTITSFLKNVCRFVLSFKFVAKFVNSMGSSDQLLDLDSLSL